MLMKNEHEQQYLMNQSQQQNNTKNKRRIKRNNNYDSIQNKFFKAISLFLIFIFFAILLISHDHHSNNINEINNNIHHSLWNKKDINQDNSINKQNKQYIQSSQKTQNKQLQPSHQIQNIETKDLKNNNIKNNIISNNPNNVNNNINNNINKYRPRINNYPQQVISKKSSNSLSISPKMALDMKNANISNTSLQIAFQYYDLTYHTPSQALKSKQKQYYQNKYNLYQSQYQQQLPFCIVMLGRNNIQNNRYKLSLNSIFNQQYQNYHVVLVDDFSIDNYAQQAQKYINQNSKYPDKFKIIKTQQQNKPMKNHYIVSQNYCEQQQLYIIVDGDDALIGTQTLKLFNYHFQKYDAWFVWGNYYATFADKIGMSGQMSQNIIKQNSYRTSKQWVTSHPKVFYNKLFRNIKKQDLSFHEQEFFPAAADRAIVYPIVQMAIDHLLYIPQILYLYLDLTAGSQQFKFGNLSRQIIKYLTPKQKYDKLECLFKDQKKNCIKASQWSLAKIKRN